jgi:hypothetical protein
LELHAPIDTSSHMVIQYDAQELGTFRTFIRIRGTMLPMVLAAPIFWVLVVLHAVLQVLANLSSEVTARASVWRLCSHDACLAPSRRRTARQCSSSPS